MAHDNLTYDDLLRIVELIKSSEQFSEFRLKVGDIEIELRRRQRSAGIGASPSGPEQPASAAMPEQSASAETPTGIAPLANEIGPTRTQVPAIAATWAPGSIVVRAPMVGTFYRAPEPGAAPFVEIGQPVEADTTVCIIEVMKLMNSITAGARGIVVQILVADGAPVEADAPLIVLDPGPGSRSGAADAAGRAEDDGRTSRR